jgi:integrase/recombinase XerD
VEASVTIAEYKQHLESLGYAPATVTSYRKGLSQFLGWLRQRRIEDLRRVSRQVVLDYQQMVMAQPIAMESKALKIRPVKRLFEHLVDTHRLLLSPAEGIVETCRRHRRVGPVLTRAEVKMLLAQPKVHLKSGIRDRAVMEVLYATGIRLGELLGLARSHADIRDRVLYIRQGKGGRQRVVPLGEAAAAWLEAYLKEVRPVYAKRGHQQRALWLNRLGRAMGAESVRQALRRARLAAGIAKPVSPHTLRRTCATHLLQAGADIRHIQRLLGHRHLSTTQLYTKILPVEVKRTHEKTHPGVGL